MIQLPCILLSLLYLVQCQHHNTTPPICIPSIALSKSLTCPLLNTSAQRELVGKTLQSYYSSDGPPFSCGGAGGWTRAVYLNMSDPNKQCPSNWTLITTPIRGCGRRAIRARQCDSVTYSVHGRTYSSVCGRILAYQRGWAGAFYHAINSNLDTIDSAYLSGVSLTHGPAETKQHIWSFVGTRYEQDPNYFASVYCPCTNTNFFWPHQVPSFINNDYFCDTGNPGPLPPTISMTHCGMVSTSTCCEFNTPPWFCKSLPQPTSDDLEIRNCYADGSHFDTHVILYYYMFTQYSLPFLYSLSRTLHDYIT